jgi:hypothetical protein
MLSALEKLSEEDEVTKCLSYFFINIDKLPDRISPCCRNNKSKFDRTLFRGTTLSVDNKSYSRGKLTHPDECNNLTNVEENCD